MKFKSKLALLTRKTITKEIAGQSFVFYPVSVPMLFELKSTMKPLMSAFQLLFSKRQEQLGAQTVEETRDPSFLDKDGRPGVVVSRVTHLGAPDLGLIQAQADREDKMLAQAIDTILCDQNRLLLGRVLADSLKDEEIRTDADVAEFIKDPAFDLPLLIQFLSGFFQVNASVFGPFAERVKELIQSKMSNLHPDPASSEPDAESNLSPDLSPSGQSN